MSKASEYNEHSIDSQITKLITQNENDAEERHLFRVQLLTRLEKIDSNTSNLDLRVSRLEANHKIYSDACNNCKKRLEPIFEAANQTKYSWKTLKNILLGISFIFGLALSIYGFFK